MGSRYATAEQLAQRRAAADEVIPDGTGQRDSDTALAMAAARREPWVRDYVQRARATLACLDGSRAA